MGLKAQPLLSPQGGQPTQPKTKPVVAGQKKVGRNDPCPCGSGKKYKKCHYPEYG
jgi:preprotein translocase subunit SecA